MKSPVYILIPVHNRKIITLSCLERLEQQQCIANYHVVVIDDGSTDGTATAISEQYPDVTVLAGDGSLWWTGAIVLGMKFAIAQGAEHFIWLNDDTLPESKAIDRLVEACIETPNLIASAQCYEDDTFQKGSFGGHYIDVKKLSSEIGTTSPGQQKLYDGLSGNLVCFPRSVVDRLGYPNVKWMPHCDADVVYTFQAKQQGFELAVIGDARAVCPMNPIYQSWFEGPISIGQRWAMISTPKSNLYPPTLLYGSLTIYGLRGIICCLQEYQRMLLITAIILLVPNSWIQWFRKRRDEFKNSHKNQLPPLEVDAPFSENVSDLALPRKSV